jgi:hypothetical protein
MASTLVVALSYVTSSSSATTLLVPQSPWPVCSATVTAFCVQSVSVQSPDGAAVTLTWVPSGSAAPTGSSTSTTTTTTTSPTTTTSTTVPSSAVESTTAVPGFWTDAAWSSGSDASLGFGGLFVDVGAANAFSNYVLATVDPAIQNPSGDDVFLAVQSGSNYPASLNPDDLITVSLNTGNAEPGVSMAIGKNFSDNVSSGTNPSTYSFTASPVPVAVAADTSACTGETGVAATESTQLQVIVAPTNDPTSGFGVDGVSGRMYVESNGACELSTPVWSASTSSLSWVVGAPHFLPDGSTVNQGFYQAMIPGSDAALLWGLTNVNAAASALSVSETSSGGLASEVAVSSVSVKGGNIIVSSTGFDFSSPHFKITKNPKYPWKLQSRVKILHCVKGSHQKTVAALSPKCPAGYHRK